MWHRTPPRTQYLVNAFNNNCSHAFFGLVICITAIAIISHAFIFSILVLSSRAVNIPSIWCINRRKQTVQIRDGISCASVAAATAAVVDADAAVVSYESTTRTTASCDIVSTQVRNSYFELDALLTVADESIRPAEHRRALYTSDIFNSSAQSSIVRCAIYRGVNDHSNSSNFTWIVIVVNNMYWVLWTSPVLDSYKVQATHLPVE